MHTLSFDEHSMQTRRSLLGRLRDWEDAASWEEFYHLYRKMVYGLARRNGLTHAEAEDVAQDVFKRVAETIHDFDPAPHRGSFRRWLMNLTHWRIADRFRDRFPEFVEGGTDVASPPRDGTRTVERIPDTRLQDHVASWERDWQRSLFETAMARLAQRTPAKHFQMFDLYVRQRWSILRIARELGANPGTIYIVSHRLLKHLRREIEKIESQVG